MHISACSSYKAKRYSEIENASGEATVEAKPLVEATQLEPYRANWEQLFERLGMERGVAESDDLLEVLLNGAATALLSRGAERHDFD